MSSQFKQHDIPKTHKYFIINTRCVAAGINNFTYTIPLMGIAFHYVE